MTSDTAFKYALCALAPIIGIIIIREIPIGYVAADYYYYQRTFFDFFELGGTWEEMHFGAAPGLFTNLLPVWVESWFLEHLTRLFLFHICLYGMLTGGVIWLIARSINRDSMAAVFTMAMAILLIIAVGSENSFWNRPSHHYGSVINLLICLLLLLAGPGRWMAMAGVWLVAILTVISDFLFIPVYVAMVGGVLLTYWLTGQGTLQRVLLEGVLLAIPVGIGVGIYYLILPNAAANPVWASGLSIRSVLTSPATHIAALQFLGAEALRLPIYLGSAILGLLAWLSLRGGRPTANRFLAVLIGVQTVVWGNIYLSGLGDPDIHRYRLFAVNLPCVLIAQSVAVLTLRKRGLLGLKWAGFTLLAGLGIGYLVWPDQERIEYVHKVDKVYFDYIDEVRCMADAARGKQLDGGIGAYKDASPYTILSGGELFLYPVDGRSLKPANHLVSRVGLKRKFNFAVVSLDLTRFSIEDRNTYYPLSRAVVEAAYGQPLETHVCADKMLMIYSQLPFGNTGS